MLTHLSRFMLVIATTMAGLSFLPAHADGGNDGFCGKRNTNVLVHDDAFMASVNEFIGERRAHYLYDGQLSDQMLSALGGPPKALKTIGDDLVLAEACRHNFCPTKGAIIIKCPSTVKAAGLVHFLSDGRYSSESTATIFVHGDEESNAAAIAELREWAARHEAKKVVVENLE